MVPGSPRVTSRASSPAQRPYGRCLALAGPTTSAAAEQRRRAPRAWGSGLSRRGLGGLACAGLLLVAGCRGQATGAGQAATSTPGEAVAAEVVCGAVDEGALAVFDGATCPWSLIAGEAGLRLESAAPGVGSLSVEAPRPCLEAPGRCRWEGAKSSLGPVLLAIVDGPESEVPVDLWVGAGLDGERVLFAELWWGEPSVIDRTEVGPVYTLAPQECAGLVLRVEARLPEAKYGAPDPALSERAGAYGFDAEGLVRTGPVPDAAACRPIFAALP